jgi:hypothetical protein
MGQNGWKCYGLGSGGNSEAEAAHGEARGGHFRWGYRAGAASGAPTKAKANHQQIVAFLQGIRGRARRLMLLSIGGEALRQFRRRRDCKHRVLRRFVRLEDIHPVKVH